MCGRMAITDPDRVMKKFKPDDIRTPIEKARYNVAPGQKIAAVVQHEGRRVLGDLQWGLVPSWAKDPSIGNRMINARAETVSEKPAFRNAFKRRRCLIPVDGFYEWKKIDDGKVPYFIHLADREPFAFAGLYEVHGSGEDRLASCTIITTTPNACMKPLHHRMPVILPEAVWGAWLAAAEPEAHLALLKPYPDGAMEAYAVSRHVNRPTNDDPECIAAA